MKKEKKVILTDGFFESFKRAFIDIKKPWRVVFWEDLYYNTKWYFWALFKYHKVVKQMRPWDASYIFQMMRFQLEILLPQIENGNEVDESRLEKVKDIKRLIELLNNHINDDYFERCGFDYNFDFNFVDTDDNNLVELKTTETEEQSKKNSKVVEDAYELEKAEMKEISKLITKMPSWWN
jgi:hypothetical protein